MTAPYRLRDAFTDAGAAVGLASVVVLSSILGFALSMPIQAWSMLLFAGYVAFVGTLLLSIMYLTDRRLREVSG